MLGQDLIGEAVELVDEAVDFGVGGVDLTLEEGFVVGGITDEGTGREVTVVLNGGRALN